MKQELLHVTKSLSSILSRVFNSIFICASNSFRACLVVVMIIAGMVGAVQQTQANGGIGYKGMSITKNGTQQWYNVHPDSGWGYIGCDDFQFKSATNFSGTNLGTVTSLVLNGYAVVGWVDQANNFIAGKLEYKIWKQGSSEPGTWQYFNVGNYQSPGSGATHVVCTKNDNRVVGMKDQNVNLLSGITESGTYNFKVQTFGRVQWRDSESSYGTFNDNNGGAITATFTYSAPCTPPAAFTFGAINRSSCSMANLSWNANDPALLVRYLGASPTITNPTSGTAYAAGNTLGVGTVVYPGTANNYTATFDPDKVYTFVLYRVNESGNCYSTPVSTTLPIGVPSVTTAAASDVTTTSATLGGSISSKGVGGAMLKRGIEWTLTVGGKTAGTKVDISTANSTDPFSQNFTGLQSGVTYKYKAYATNNSCSDSYGYGPEVSFTTTAIVSYYVTGTSFSGWGNWTQMTENNGIYSVSIPNINTSNATEFKLNNTNNYDGDFWKNCSVDAASCVGVTVGGNSNGSNGTLKLNSGYATPATLYFNSATKKYYAVATVACTPPAANFAASGTYNSGNWTGRFADNYRSAALSTSATAENYLWECTSSNKANVSITNATTKDATATFNLPGTYTFRVGAKCAAAGEYTYSQTVTINVPYPEIGISGPFFDGGWNHAGAGTTGKLTRSDLVYTKDFTVNDAGLDFVIIQAYKLGCEVNGGWAGYNECSEISGNNGNKILYSNSSIATSTIIGTGESNFTQNAGLTNGSTARITVTMNSYNNYTIKLEAICTPPTVTSTTGATICGTGTAVIKAVVSAGSVDWYTAATGGTKVGSSNSGADFTTPSVSATTTYYAEANDNDCVSTSRTAATVTVTAAPTISITAGPDKMCSALGSAGTYTATAVEGATYTWTSTIAGLNPAPSANTVTYTTGAGLSSGKIQVYATLNGCNSNTAEKSVSVVARPTVTSTTGASICGTGTASINAVVSAGTVDWYTATTGGTKYTTSTSGTFITSPSVSTTTSYYAEANDGGCVSASRKAAEIIVNTAPALSISGAASTTQYKPETYTASGSNLGTLTWAIVDAPAHANISATTGSTTVFKAKNGSYTLSVTATNDGCTDNETKGITVSTDSETCP